MTKRLMRNNLPEEILSEILVYKNTLLHGVEGHSVRMACSSWRGTWQYVLTFKAERETERARRGTRTKTQSHHPPHNHHPPHPPPPQWPTSSNESLSPKLSTPKRNRKHQGNCFLDKNPTTSWGDNGIYSCWDKGNQFSFMMCPQSADYTPEENQFLRLAWQYKLNSMGKEKK